MSRPVLRVMIELRKQGNFHERQIEEGGIGKIIIYD